MSVFSLNRKSGSTKNPGNKFAENIRRPIIWVFLVAGVAVTCFSILKILTGVTHHNLLESNQKGFPKDYIDIFYPVPYTLLSILSKLLGLFLQEGLVEILQLLTLFSLSLVQYPLFFCFLVYKSEKRIILKIIKYLIVAHLLEIFTLYFYY